MRKSELIIRDVRVKSHYIVDDEYLNGYAKVCGIYALGVYNVLCRHADFHTQTSFPSIQMIAQKLDISRQSVIRALAVLEAWGIIKRDRVRNPKTGRWKHNSYTLTDKSTWEPLPSTPQVHGEAHQVPVTDVDQVPVGDSKDSHTHISSNDKDTHTRELFEKKAEERKKRIEEIKADITKKFRTR